MSMKKIHLLLLLLFVAGMLQAINESKQPGVLQYTSSGHILLFDKTGVTTASGSHAMKVGFVNARQVAPTGMADSMTTTRDLSAALFVANGKSTVNTSALGHVTYTNLWSGVDLEYKASGQGVYESTYLLTPDKKGKVHVERICLAYNRDLVIDKNGNLIISFSSGTLTESAPVAWQMIKGKRIPVAVGYKLYGRNQLGFTLGVCRSGIPVTIDPTLSWNTFLGGSGDDKCTGIVKDTSGNIYISGTSDVSWGSPIRAYDSFGYLNNIFVAKLTSDGVLSWNTFLGGTGTNTCTGITLDPSGNVYVTGSSQSTWGLPLTAFTGTQAGFVAKLTSAGVLAWNTFLGGNVTAYCTGITVDALSNVYVCGTSFSTWGSPIKEYDGNINGFVAKLTSEGALAWNTFFGYSGYLSGSNGCTGIAVDATNIYVCGYCSTNMSDGFVAKLTPAGELSWNTILGGNGDDICTGIAVDASSNVYVCGYSGDPWGFPLNAYAGDNDGFLAKFTNAGVLSWNTFFGEFLTICNGITVDASSNVYVCGEIQATWGSPIRAYSSGRDGFLAKFSSAGALSWNTFLGGSGDDGCTGITTDASSNVFVTGSGTTSWGIPLQGSSIGSSDGFVAKIASTAAIASLAATAVSTTTARLNGNIYDFGDASLASNYGFCYSTTNTIPTTSDVLVNLGSTTTTGVYNSTISSLTSGTRYYVRAFVTNVYGTSYGAVATFIATNIAPGGLSYNTPNNFTKGTVITSLSPTVSGGAVTTYSISPALPAGLSISSTTGMISGTPTVLATTASYTITAANSGGSTTFSVSITVNSAIKQLTVKVYLEGLWNSTNSNMNKSKKWDFGLEDIADAFGGTVVDTVSVELHDPNSYASILYEAHGLELNQDGFIHTPGKLYIEVPGILSGGYSLTVKHRNHLETTSSSAVSFAGNTVNYDFTDAVTKAYQSDPSINPTKEVVPGKWMFYAGDILLGSFPEINDQDLYKTFGDRSGINGIYGYVLSDIDGSGTVDDGDIYLLFTNRGALLYIP